MAQTKTASCLCGKCTAVLTGDPQYKALCHCDDCKKISGSVFSTNVVVDAGALRPEQGTLKSFAKEAESGGTITSYFCGDCGTTLWRETTSAPDVKFVKEGIVDSLSKEAPTVELFSKKRVDWVPQLSGAKQA